MRGVGYHESVAGEIDRHWLDRAVPHVPLRVQHRSGRLWIFNSAGLAQIGAWAAGSPFERVGSDLTGRIYDADDWMAEHLPRGALDLHGISALLAARGVTAITDATARNDAASFARFASARAGGELLQHVALLGVPSLDDCASVPGCAVLGRKLHLHDGDYPDPDEVVALFRQAGARGLTVAVHCVTEADLIFTLSLIEEARSPAQWRIEHASVTPDAALPRLHAAGVTIVTQPHFIAERGDAYANDVQGCDQPLLYRAASFLHAGVALAGGSDAPFGHYDPWRSMQTAVDRTTACGRVIGPAECLSPEAALRLYTTHWAHPGGAARRVAVGQKADMCLLRQSWAEARRALDCVQVAATIQDGTVIFAGAAAPATIVQ